MQKLTRAFSHAEFGEVRVVDIDGKVGFYATDIAIALGYAKPHNAISRHCRASLKRGVIDSLGRKQTVNVILKPDVWR